MEDIHLAENRGRDTDAMLDAMQERGVLAPVFQDKRDGRVHGHGAALAEEGGTQALKILPMKLELDDFNKTLSSILFS